MFQQLGLSRLYTSHFYCISSWLSCQLFISVLCVFHVGSSCQFFVKCFMLVFYVSVSCQFFISMLHVSSSCLQFVMSVLHVSSSCQFFMSVLHVSSSYQFFMSVLHVSSSCQFFMSVLHVKIFVPLKFLVRRRTLVLNLIAFKS